MAVQPLAEQIARIKAQKAPQKGAPSTLVGGAPAKPGKGGGGKGNQVRARRRLARIRLADPKALPGVKPTASGNLRRKDRYAVLGAVRDLNKKQRTKRDKDRANAYDPLKPLVGKDMQQELDAAEKLEFGESDRVLGEAFKSQKEHEGVVGSAYDQYRQALTDATGRINAANAAAAQGTQTAVDTAYTQDKAAQDERDKAQAAKMSALGLEAAKQDEGARAVEAGRTQGNLRAGDIREQGTADTTFMEGRGTTAVQAKAEALRREGRKREELEGKKRTLASEKGAFRVSHRGKLREGEREWAAIAKEFDLKEKGIAQKGAGDKASARAQVLVAKLYADANKAKARATIRVAKLQLEKGKIDQKQYRKIVNIYKGLPEKGKAPEAKKPDKGGTPKLQTWETDKVDKAINSLNKDLPTAAQKAKYIKRMVDGGMPVRLARIAWARYRKPLDDALKFTGPH